VGLPPFSEEPRFSQSLARVAVMLTSSLPIGLSTVSETAMLLKATEEATAIATGSFLSMLMLHFLGIGEGFPLIY
jgi:hypothetical protein